jgi:hypothetical protein
LVLFSAVLHSAVAPVKDFLHTENIAMTKIKRDLSTQKSYKAMAWGQLSSFGHLKLCTTQVVQKYQGSMQQCWRLEKGNLIKCLHKTYESKRGEAIAFMTGCRSGDATSSNFFVGCSGGIFIYISCDDMSLMLMTMTT